MPGTSTIATPEDQTWSLTCAVLGRFLHSLNEYCEEEHGLHYDISDYDEYDFHKVTTLLVR